MGIKSLITICFIGTLSITTPIQAESLMEIYQLAIKNDPKFLSSKALMVANTERINQSFSKFLPTLSGNYRYSYNRSGSSQETFTDFFGASKGSELSRDSFTLNLQQTIYDYSTWVNYDQDKKRVEQEQVRYKASQQDLIVRVAQVYLDVLSATDNLTFASAEQKAIKQELEQTKQRYQVGLIAITDVHEAQARFDQSEADRIGAQNRLDNAHEALREVTGRYTENLNVLNQKLPLISPKPAQIDDWVQVSRESNLDIISASMDLYLARQDIKRRFGGHLPKINLNASYSDTTTNPVGIVSNTDSYSVSAAITLSIPIYSGGLTNSRIKEGKALFQKASHDLESAMRRTVRTTRSSYLNVEASIARIKALQQSVISQESALEATQAGFEVGTRTIVDVLLSTRSLFSAKSGLSTARYNYVLAILKLKQAAGILTSDDLVEINRWMSPK